MRACGRYKLFGALPAVVRNDARRIKNEEKRPLQLRKSKILCYFLECSRRKLLYELILSFTISSCNVNCDGAGACNDIIIVAHKYKSVL